MRTSVPIMSILAAIAPLSAAQAQATPDHLQISGTRLDVSAEGEVRRAPDIAMVSAGVMTQAATASAAMKENASRMTAVIAALRKAGVAEKDMQTSSVNLQPQYRYQENQPPQLVGYQASNMVQVRFRKIEDSGRIIDALVAQGANQINGPSLSVDQADAALDEARTAALAKARQRAELYAKAAGLRVKRIISISEGGAVSPPMPYPVARMSMAKAEMADTPMMPGETEMSVTVNVSFELE